MIVPQIDVDGIARRGLLAPEFARGETDGVEMLRLRGLKMRVRVRKNEDTMIALDRSDFAARVARQARVPGRIDIAAAHRLPHLEARYRWGVALHGIASANHRRHRFGGDRRRGFWPSPAGPPPFHVGPWYPIPVPEQIATPREHLFGACRLHRYRPPQRL